MHFKASFMINSGWTDFHEQEASWVAHLTDGGGFALWFAAQTSVRAALRHAVLLNQRQSFFSKTEASSLVLIRNIRPPSRLSYLLGLLAVGDGAGRIPAGLQRQVVVSLHQRQVVSRPQVCLQEERGADAAQLAVGDDGDAIAQDVGLVHVVGGEDDGAA